MMVFNVICFINMDFVVYLCYVLSNITYLMKINKIIYNSEQDILCFIQRCKFKVVNVHPFKCATENACLILNYSCAKCSTLPFFD